MHRWVLLCTPWNVLNKWCTAGLLYTSWSVHSTSDAQLGFTMYVLKCTLKKWCTAGFYYVRLEVYTQKVMHSWVLLCMPWSVLSISDAQLGYYVRTPWSVYSYSIFEHELKTEKGKKKERKRKESQKDRKRTNERWDSNIDSKGITNG